MYFLVILESNARNVVSRFGNTVILVLRERTLSMLEAGPEGFTNFSKNVS